MGMIPEDWQAAAVVGQAVRMAQNAAYVPSHTFDCVVCDLPGICTSAYCDPTDLGHHAHDKCQ